MYGNDPRQGSSEFLAWWTQLEFLKHILGEMIGCGETGLSLKIVASGMGPNIKHQFISRLLSPPPGGCQGKRLPTWICKQHFGDSRQKVLKEQVQEQERLNEGVKTFDICLWLLLVGRQTHK